MDGDGDGEGEGMLSNIAGDSAEKNQTRTLTLDQDQEGDGKEKEEAKVEADSDAGRSTIDRLRDEILDLQFETRDLQIRLDASKERSRSLADEVDNLEDELVRAQQGLAEADRLKLALEDLRPQSDLLTQAHVPLRRRLAAAEEKEKEIRRLHDKAKGMGTTIRDVAEKLSFTRELAEIIVEERINEAVEEARTRLEGELAQLRSDVGERDGALAAMRNALMLSRVAAAVMSAGALAASVAAVYIRNSKKR